MTVEEMRNRKKELGYSNKYLSDISGVPVGTIQKIFSGETSSPRRETVMALTLALLTGDEEMEFHDSAPAYSASALMKYFESDFSEEKTIDDYMALPEGARVELIDGKFYDMGAPTTIHQRIGVELCHLLINYIDSNNGDCVPFVAPTDVQIDCDNRSMLQPDVFVVCDRNRITKQRIIGAPDFVIEIVSPNHVSHDVLIKMQKYKKAGVKEYWIVFPDEMSVMVYEFEKSPDPVGYTFNDSIPVGIWDGKCSIDFKKVFSKVDFMYK